MNQPGFDNKYLPVKDEVDNPYRKGERETVVRNLRESNAATLRLGPAQAQAYDRVWRLYYMMGYWRDGAIDPTKEPVDCQQTPDPYPEGAAHASKEIDHLAKTLGDDWLLIEQTCLWGRGFKEVANIMFGPTSTRTQIDEARFHVKHAYNRLCVEMGLSQSISVFEKLKSYRRKITGYLPGGKQGVDERCWEQG